MKEERLQKYLEHAGVASRRKSEEFIKAGRVKVNGKLITEMGFKVTKDDKIEVDGKIIAEKESKVYYLLHKPLNYITTTDDQFGRKTVLDLIDTNQRVYPVGRLDYDSSGLLLITNDGGLTNKLIHPSYEVWKEYLVEVNGFLDNNTLRALEEGVSLEDGKTAPAKIRLEHRTKEKSKAIISIHEGKNRQVRRMFDFFNLDVLSLKRIKFGPLKLGNLGYGKYRKLTDYEIQQIKRIKRR